MDHIDASNIHLEDIEEIDESEEGEQDYCILLPQFHIFTIV